jgi:hypothetical protein
MLLLLAALLPSGAAGAEPWQAPAPGPALLVRAAPFAAQARPALETSAAARTQRHRVTIPRRPGLHAAVALGGIAVRLAASAMRRTGRPDRLRRLLDGLLLGLGVAGLFLWANPVRILRGETIHIYEFYHYYVGAKYFPELGYTRLYECTTLADREDGLAERVERRTVRNLETNSIEGTEALLADPSLCKRQFSRKRWAAFRRDIRFFRLRLPPARWERMLKDHGYNGTPAWGLLGAALARTGPASVAQIGALALLDPLLLAALGATIAWAFGWRTLLVALIFFGTWFPATGSWTAGAYLRQDWLLTSIAGICLLRRGYPAAAGAALAWAGLLRLFPLLILGGVAAKALGEMLVTRRVRLSDDHRRFALSALSTALVLVGFSSMSAGGSDAWVRFAENSRLHLTTPLLNYMGLRTVIAYDPDTRAKHTLDRTSADPLSTWKLARRDTFAARRPLFWATVAAFALLLVFATRGEPDWVAATLGIGLIPVAAELTCYYQAILVGYALLVPRLATVGVMLLGLAALSQAVPLPWDEIDEVYTALSLVMLAFVFAVTTLFALSATAPGDGRMGIPRGRFRPRTRRYGRPTGA